MVELERYVISIDPCPGISDSAMASMLSCWVSGTVHSQQWLTDEVIQSMINNQRLKASDIELMAVRVLDALEACGLYSHLLLKVENLDLVACQVRGNLAYLELEWKSRRDESSHRYETTQ